MTIPSSSLRQHAARLIAITLVAITYVLARQPVLPELERSALAQRFHFSQPQPLPELMPEWPGHAPQLIRKVNPNLAKIAGWVSSVGAAAALGDLDGNGLPDDVCYVDTRTDMVIVAPLPGTVKHKPLNPSDGPTGYKPFALSPAPLAYEPATMAPMGCLLNDLNEDGLLDILIYYWGRTPIAFLRSAAGYEPREVVADRLRWFTNAATLADLDGDGHTDLVIANYYPDGTRILDANAPSNEVMQDSMSRAANGGSKHFLLWANSTSGAEPAVEFREARGVLPAEIDHGWTLAVAASDLDGDLLPELYFANDFGPDRLVYNLSKPGHLQFNLLQGVKTLSTPNSSVLGRDSFKGMGVDIADVNRDGLPDIYVGNLTMEYGLVESHLLFVNTGQADSMKRGVAPFVNRSEPLGLSRSGWAWDSKLVDFDNDGVPEAMQATGFLKGNVNRWPELQELAMGNDRLLQHPRSWPRFEAGDDLSGHQHNPFFVQASDGRFHDLAEAVGLGESHISRGIAVADVDGDGGLDFVLANQWESSCFYHNEAPRRGAFLGLHLLLPLSANPATTTQIRPGHPTAETPGRAAMSASATVFLHDGRRVVAQLDGGNGHSGKRSPELHFGLGAIHGTEEVRVEVHWRDREGRINSETFSLRPGWYTILLGSAVKGGLNG